MEANERYLFHLVTTKKFSLNSLQNTQNFSISKNIKEQEIKLREIVTDLNSQKEGKSINQFFRL